MIKKEICQKFEFATTASVDSYWVPVPPCASCVCPSAMPFNKRTPLSDIFCTSSCTAASTSAPLAWRALRLLRSVVPPTPRAAMLPCIVPCNYALPSTIGSAMTSTSVSAPKL